MDNEIWPDEGAPAGADEPPTKPTAEGEPAAPAVTDAPAADAETAATPTPPPQAGDERPLRERIIDAICTVFDPEIPVNIWELGLVYDIGIDEEAGTVAIQMTLTSPACPVAESLPADVQARVGEVAGVNDVSMELVWEPPWTMEKLTDAAKLQLGLM